MLPSPGVGREGLGSSVSWSQPFLARIDPDPQPQHPRVPGGTRKTLSIKATKLQWFVPRVCGGLGAFPQRRLQRRGGARSLAASRSPPLCLPFESSADSQRRAICGGTLQQSCSNPSPATEPNLGPNPSSSQWWWPRRAPLNPSVRVARTPSKTQSHARFFVPPFASPHASATNHHTSTPAHPRAPSTNAPLHMSTPH